MYSYSPYPSMANAELQQRNLALEPEISSYTAVLPRFHHSHAKNKKWTAQEDQTILRMQADHGNKWTMIMTFLPGRSKHSVRNRWNTIMRKKSYTNKPKKIAPAQPFIPTDKKMNERHARARAFVYATQLDQPPRTGSMTETNEGNTNTYANYVNAALMEVATTSTPSHPTSTTYGLMTHTHTNNQNTTTSTNANSATRPLSTGISKQYQSPMIQLPTNQHQLPSGESTANHPRPLSDLKFEPGSPTIVVVNLSDIDSSSSSSTTTNQNNNNEPPKLSPLPTTARMANPEAEGEEQLLLDDDKNSFAYAVAFAASLIHADDNDCLCQSITDDDDNSHDSGPDDET